MKKSAKVILCMLPMLAMFSCGSKKQAGGNKDILLHSQTGDSDTITTRYNRSYSRYYPFWLWHNHNYISRSQYRQSGRFISPSLFNTPHTTSFQRGGFGKTSITKGGFHS